MIYTVMLPRRMFARHLAAVTFDSAPPCHRMLHAAAGVAAPERRVPSHAVHARELLQRTVDAGNELAQRSAQTVNSVNSLNSYSHSTSAPSSESPSHTSSSASSSPSSTSSSPISASGPSSLLSSSSQQSESVSYDINALPPMSDPLLITIVKNLQRDGKKAQASRHVLEMLRYLANVLHADPLPAVERAVRAASPLVRMQSRKTGSKTTHVPLALNERQQTRRGIVAILDASRRRGDTKLHVRMAKEILAVLDNQSSALAKKEELHRVATANRSNTGIRI